MVSYGQIAILCVKCLQLCNKNNFNMTFSFNSKSNEELQQQTSELSGKLQAKVGNP